VVLILNAGQPDLEIWFLWWIIVYRGEWLWSPTNIKGANKDAKIYVGRSMTVYNLLFCIHTLCMNYETKTFLLDSSSLRSKQLLCFVYGQDQKRQQNCTTTKIAGLQNHSRLLTMLCVTTTERRMLLYLRSLVHNPTPLWIDSKVSSVTMLWQTVTQQNRAITWPNVNIIFS